MKKNNYTKYSNAKAIETLRDLAMEYRQGASIQRIDTLLKRFKLIKERGLKTTNEEQSN